MATTVSISGQQFLVNDRPTYEGRTWRGHRIEGLLMNSRMVQATFDDLNPETRSWWDYPDGPWDPERNVQGFLAQMPEWREAGMIGFTINFQGGSPIGYSKEQPWHNSAFTDTGELRPDYLDRLARVLARADELGMVPIVGLLYFGQEPRFPDEETVLRAVDNATDWLLERGHGNVVIEICNESDSRSYRHEIVRSERVHELVARVQERSAGKLATPAGRLLVGASLCGGVVPPDRLVAASDFLLLHGNGVKQPDRIRAMVDETRARPSYRDQPVLFNEDDHFDFDADDNNMIAAVSRYAGWGLFDWRMPDEAFEEGYQSAPTDWTTSSERKRGFFRLLKEMTGGQPAAR